MRNAHQDEDRKKETDDARKTQERAYARTKREGDEDYVVGEGCAKDIAECI